MSNRTMKRGDTLVIDVQVTQPVPGALSDPTTGLVPQIPQPITGWNFWFTAKYNYADPDTQAVTQLTTSPVNGIAVIDAVNGKIEITVPPLATRAFPDQPTTIIYDVQAKDTTGRIFTVEDGTITVNPDVTRAIS